MKDLTIEITDKCSLACAHCSTYGGDKEDILLDKKEFLFALNSFPNFEKVRISGGEPFMHPDLIWFLKQAKAKQRITEILTCGVCYGKPLPTKIVKQCKGLTENIGFSLYGGRETHERICQYPGVFEIFDESVNRVISNQIPFSFTFVPMRVNKNGLEEAIMYVAGKAHLQNYCNPPIWLLRYIQQGEDEQNVGYKSLALRQGEVNQIIAKSKRLSKKYDINVYFGCSLDGKGCRAGTGKVVIPIHSSHGEFSGCSALKWEASLNWNPPKRKPACKDKR